MESTAFLVFAYIAIAIQTLVIILFFFEPALPYKIRKNPKIPTESKKFRRLLETISASHLEEGNKVEVLTNGKIYFEAELEAIRNAKSTIHMEAYIFQRGKVVKRFVETLAERARAGVTVRIVIDSIGSFLTRSNHFRELLDAGGRVERYHPFRWYLLPRVNNRTHREIIVVDGSVAFVGGSGFADHWLYGTNGQPAWRDTMFRVEGEVVRSIQGAFAENWLEASGEIICDEDCFGSSSKDGKTPAMIVSTSPSAGRSTRNRMLFQTLIASATKSIFITSPYFLPDAGARDEMARARKRGVDIKVIVPGQKIDHLLTRRSSRRLYGDLLKAGIEIYEYKPAMIHTKSMIVDGIWSVVGSTNFDHRSFGLNDEINLVTFDEKVAFRICEDFEEDLSQSEVVTYEKWRKRSLIERIHEYFGSILERQQ